MMQQALENVNNIIEQSTAKIQEFITWVSINKNALYIIILVTAISIILLIIGYIIKLLKKKVEYFFLYLYFYTNGVRWVLGFLISNSYKFRI